MFRFKSTNGLAIINTKRVLFLGLSLLLASSGLGVANEAFAKRRAVAQSVVAAERADPEVLLIDIYKTLGADHLREALAKANKLVAAYPNFRLGQLVRGDLLLMQTHVVTSFGPPNAPEEKLRNLRDEAA